MPDPDAAKPSPMIFVIARDSREREALRAMLIKHNFLAIAIENIGAAVTLLQNQALCNLIILSTDALGGDANSIDPLISAVTPHPNIVIYGIDPSAKLVLHCLAAGASDFLPKTASEGELAMAVENALSGGTADPDSSPGGVDNIQAVSPVTGWIELTAASQMETLRRLQRFSDALFATHLPPEVCEDLKLAVEEVGRNAVDWGNHFNPDKRVHVSYCIFNDRIVIKVEDEGEGFVPSSVPNPTLDPVKTMQDRKNAGKRAGGYGVYLIQKLVDDIFYNEKGNTVLLIKHLPVKAGG